jgi:hypothetical protein
MCLRGQPGNLNLCEPTHARAALATGFSLRVPGLEERDVDLFNETVMNQKCSVRDDGLVLIVARVV